VVLRSIVGLRRPSEGNVKVFGQNLSLPEHERSLVERRFGVLFQKGALFSSLTVTENVALPLIEHAGLSRNDAEHLAAVKLALAGLPLSAADKYPASLSGGMIKRAALARPWRWTRTSCFSTSPPPASIRLAPRLRSTDPDPARCAGPERVPGDPRPRHALHHHRPWRCWRRRRCWWPAPSTWSRNRRRLDSRILPRPAWPRGVDAAKLLNEV
jgi:hypothetical protein